MHVVLGIFLLLMFGELLPSSWERVHISVTLLESINAMHLQPCALPFLVNVHLH